ncbi:patatin-like phospholipase family protein [Ramlibacter albus]|uniref:Patatin-like phospholipase family protein n=1 Tax=Ramlibacter albus TaxID=2079448 RepID=A0A923M5X3_9BURK|nr:patatin-like phospholipase family protein [Ramlibacter albus]MBC5763404.1 patatin-like phospholipase family protein [Ramlibacter albus]
MTEAAARPAWRTALCLGLAALTLAGCTVVSGRPGVSYRNEPDLGRSFIRPQNPVPRAPTAWVADKPQFVGLAISGGGSRSANFGMAALQELDELGVLQHVDAVSAVSGGSIPAAYFALNGERTDWSLRARELAATDFALPLIGKLFNPVSLAATTFTDRDRSDMLAELFEEKLFGGRSVTFAELGPRGPRRPAVYFNATDTTNGGTRFVFSDQAFLQTTGSDLSKYPIAWAMASSGAFPGIFNSVTLRRYSLDPAKRREATEDPNDKRYLHLIDGGPSDNLGVETLIRLAREHHVNRLNAQQSAQGCMIVVVDSHVPNAGVAEMRQSDRRNFGSVVLDLNFLDAIDAMLSNRRDQTLAQMGIHRDVPQGQFNVELAPGLWDYKIRPYRRVARFPVDYYYLDGRAFTEARYLTQVNAVDLSAVRQPERREFDCHVWHVALDEIQSIVPWRVRGGEENPLDLNAPADHAVFAYRSRLGRLVSQVATSYRLSGAPNCSQAQVQEVLYDAAHIAVRQDRVSLAQVCKWFRDRGLDAAGRCRMESEPLVRPQLRVEPIRAPLNLTESEQNTDRFVKCVGTDGLALPMPSIPAEPLLPLR